MSNGTQSIDRAAGVLTFVVSADSAVSFTDVVTHTGLSRPTASRTALAGRCQASAPCRGPRHPSPVR